MRQNLFNIFEESDNAGPYDERPLLPDDVDLQLHLSKNDRPQPFFLICEEDTVLAVMRGDGTVEFKDAPVLHHKYEVGDFIYVPAGTPHRIVPKTESIHYRYKAPEPGLEAVAWYCRKCGGEVSREDWDTAEELSQEAYLRLCKAFNADKERRTCGSCGTVHPKLRLTGIRWAEIAEEIRTDIAAATRQKRPGGMADKSA